MNGRQIAFVLAGLAALSGLSGCKCPNNNRSGYVYPPGRVVAPPTNPMAANGPMPPRFVPNTSGAGGLPPGAVVVPPGSIPPPGQASPTPGATGIQQNNYLPPGPGSQQSASGITPSVYLEQPEPAFPSKKTESSSASPQMPQTAEPPKARDDSKASPDLPVDIPQFATIKANVAGGQEPFADGILWLKKHGYRSVLHVRAPGESDDVVRKQYEQAGLRYAVLDVSPQTLTKEIVDQFNRIVGDKDSLPLFVYDKDGSLAGPLWYLHYRIVEEASDEKARGEAERLGFKPDRGEAYMQMWLAVQKLLGELKK
jgi:protein tyrosine phosphatase (PTP) superfamily phosphohydrolase (DUF442 family)